MSVRSFLPWSQPAAQKSPDGAKGLDTRRILVPVRGNPADEEALRLAGEVTRRNKGTLYVLYIVEVARALPLDASMEVEAQQARQFLADVQRRAQREKFRVETELIQAREVGPAVVEEAIERGVGLVVMGMSYKRRFGQFHLGEAVPHILQHAPCEVWLCRERTPD